MSFQNKYLNVRMTSKVEDLGKAKVYAAADCASPMLHVRSITAADHAVPLIATSVNDPRKLCVIHTDTDALGGVTKTRHYVHALSGGTQYSVLSQLENRIASGDNVQELMIAHDHSDHYHTPDDYIVDDIAARLYNDYIGDYGSGANAGQLRMHYLGGYYSIQVKLRVDGVDGATIYSLGGSSHDEAIVNASFAVPSGLHTLGFHIYFSNIGRIAGDTYMWTKSMIVSNAGDPA